MSYTTTPRNVWLPIDQFDVDYFLSLSFEQEVKPEKILFYGHEASRGKPDDSSIWSFNGIYRHYETNSICYQSETWSAGDWYNVIPSQFMIVSPPQPIITETKNGQFEDR